MDFTPTRLVAELDKQATLHYLLDCVEELQDANAKLRQSLAAVAVQGPKGEPGETGCTGPRGPAGKDADESKVADLQEQLHDLREKFAEFLNGDYYQRHTIATPAYGVTPAHH